MKSNPYLFLGAGFSIGTNQKNGPLASGEDLKKKVIIDLLQFDEHSTEYYELIRTDLSRVSQFVIRTLGEQSLHDFICDNFVGVDPFPFHYQLNKYMWERIYTTNIDDVVETIFKKNKQPLLIQNMKRASTLKKQKQTEYFKLHGCVNNPSEGFTFSTSEYLDSIKNSTDHRISSFCIDIHTHDFIFLGTSFDEINLDYYLKRYEEAGSTRGKLFFISPSNSILMKSRISELNGILIPWNTEEFLYFISNNINKNQGNTKETLERNLIHKGFIPYDYYVRDNKGENKSQLYFGYEPKIEDILYDWDFINPRIEEVITDIHAGQWKYFLITGKSLVGKTTALLRVGMELQKSGYFVLHAIGRELNLKSLQELLRENKTQAQVAILIDDASFVYNSISNLHANFFNDKKVVFVTTSRVYMHSKKKYNFRPHTYKEYLIDSDISFPLAQKIVTKLEEKGYLGNLQKFATQKEQIEYFLHKNDLMSALIDITYSNSTSGFHYRFRKEINEAFRKNDGSVRSFLIILSLFEKLDLPYVPNELVTLIYKSNSKDLLNKSNDYTKNSRMGGIKLRSGHFHKEILYKIPPQTIVEEIKEILIAISGQITEHGRSYWNEIFEAFLKHKFLSDVLKINNTLINELYSKIRRYFDHLSYYWLQLGLVEQRIGEFDRAYNHFRQAEVLQPNSYQIKHAIGRNYMRHAKTKFSLTEAVSLFEEGEEVLLSLIKERELYQARAFSVHCYIFEKISFCRKFNQEISNEKLREMLAYLNDLQDKDNPDPRFESIKRYLYKYIKDVDKLAIIKIKIEDLVKYSYLFKSINEDQLTWDLDPE